MVIKGDTRSLDSSSYLPRSCFGSSVLLCGESLKNTNLKLGLSPESKKEVETSWI